MHGGGDVGRYCVSTPPVVIMRCTACRSRVPLACPQCLLWASVAAVRTVCPGAVIAQCVAVLSGPVSRSTP
eukprot:3307655-Lingulodinium_polyedra.AAC.1